MQLAQIPAITIDENRVSHIFRDEDDHFREDNQTNRQTLIDVQAATQSTWGLTGPAIFGMLKILLTALRFGLAYEAAKSLTEGAIRSPAISRDYHDEKEVFIG